MTPEEARGKQAVQLEACVTFFDPTHTSMLVHDGHEGLFVRVPENFSKNPNLKVGALVRIHGVAHPGEFIPHILGQAFEVLGETPLPTPLRINGDSLFAPMLDCQWVELSAIVSGVETNTSYVTLVLEVSGWSIKAQLPKGPQSDAETAKRMQRLVTVRGVVGTVFNSQRQLTGRYLFVPSFDYIVLAESGDRPSPPQTIRVDELLGINTSPLSPVCIQGVVTHATGEGLYVRGKGGSLLIRTGEGQRFALGTEVEAEGFAAVAPFRPILRATRVSNLKLGAEPEPLPFEFGNEQMIRQQAELVNLDADFLARRDGPQGETILQCRAGGWFFEAVLIKSNDLVDSLSPNDRVRLTGICELIANHPLPPAEWGDGFRLHLRNADDIVRLERAPWWTLSRLLWALVLVGGMALGFFAWGWLLRRRVAAQTKVIGAQIEQSAVKDERQRIARELHDTIEQELAGLAIQLRNARQRLTDAPEQAASALELAQQMLRHCREESRTSIRDLRSVALEQRGLRGAMEELLPVLAAEYKAQVTLNVAFEFPNLPGPTALHLLRIAHEGVVNAARHSASHEIQVSLGVHETELFLEIQDNGRGFDASLPSPRGHFGLLGIRERVDKLCGTLTIRSGSGDGTLIRVTFPFPDPTNQPVL